MNEQFTCNGCRKRFDLKERTIVTPNTGQLCYECADKMDKSFRRVEKTIKIAMEKEFEKKVIKIIEKWWRDKSKKEKEEERIKIVKERAKEKKECIRYKKIIERLKCPVCKGKSTGMNPENICNKCWSKAVKKTEFR